MDLQRLDEIQQEHREWADRNFPGKNSYQTDALGVLEEIGEITHHRLKRIQGIRGTPEYHINEEIDGLADACIYLLGVCDHSGHRLSKVFRQYHSDATEKYAGIELLFRAATHAGYLGCGGVPIIQHDPYYIYGVWKCLEAYALGEHAVDLFLNLQLTWDKVKRRDWQAHPVDADVESNLVELPRSTDS